MNPVLVYLAGPDVFLPDPLDAAERKRAICAAAGLKAVFPLDAAPDMPPDIPLGTPAAAPGSATRIAAHNEGHIRRCDAVLANLTPFRGPSADAGTVYEVGFARALGKPVFGYSNTGAPYEARVGRWAGQPDALRDPEGLEIERFGLADNLMIACGIVLSGGTVVALDCAPDARWTDLRAFRLCVARAALLIPPGPRPGDRAPRG